jgi:putative membrane protein
MQRMTPERDPRIYYSAERTFLSWIRTGLAMMGFGFVVARFGLFLLELGVARGEIRNDGSGSIWAGTALVLLGVFVNIYAAAAHVRFRRRFDAGDSEPARSNVGIILAGLLAVIGMSMAVYLIQRA